MDRPPDCSPRRTGPHQEAHCHVPRGTHCARLGECGHRGADPRTVGSEKFLRQQHCGRFGGGRRWWWHSALHPLMGHSVRLRHGGRAPRGQTRRGVWRKVSGGRRGLCGCPVVWGQCLDVLVTTCTAPPARGLVWHFRGVKSGLFVPHGLQPRCAVQHRWPEMFTPWPLAQSAGPWF